MGTWHVAALRDVGRIEELKTYLINSKLTQIEDKQLLSLIQSETKDLDKAISVAQKLVDNYPFDANLLDHLGDLYAKKGIFQKASECYQKELDIYQKWKYENDTLLTLEHAGAVSQLEQVKLKLDITQIKDRVLKITPEHRNMQDYKDIAAMYVIEAKYDVALKECKAALKLGEDDYIYYLMGDIYANTQDYHQAKQYYEEGLKLNPNSESCKNGLKWLEPFLH